MAALRLVVVVVVGVVGLVGEVRCSKFRYASEHDAQVALVGAVIKHNRGKAKRRECRHYACPRCGGWHLTSREKWSESP